MDGRALLRGLLDEADLNPNSLAGRLGDQSLQSKLSRYLSGKAIEPRRSTMEPVARFFGIAAEAFYNEDLASQIAQDRGLARFDDQYEAPEPALTPETTRTRFLPGFEALSIPVLAQSGSMGRGEHLLPDEVVVGRLTVSPEWVSRTLKPLTDIRHLRFIHGYGDSMEPTFMDGDILLVDSGVQDPDIDGVYVLEANDRIYIKRVRQRLDGKYEISSDNPTVKTVDVLDGSQSVTVRGRVVWCWNGKKL